MSTTAGPLPRPTRPSTPAPPPSTIRALLRVVGRPGVLSLAGGLPDVGWLDPARVERAVAAALAEPGRAGATALQYGPTEGVDGLRTLLAARHGVPVEEVLVTSGAQQGIYLVARALVGPAGAAVVEDPAYPGAVQAYRAAGAELVGVPGDAEGIDVEAAAGALRATRGRAAVVHVVPTLANPTSATLPAERRRALADLVEAEGAWLIEDDPYAELAPGAAPASTARWGDRVVRIGSSSKVLAPGLRVGWVVAPAEVVDRLARHKQAADLHTSCLTQLVVAHLLADEAAQRGHVDAVRAALAERAGALRAALDVELAGRLEVPGRDAGMFGWARTVDGTDAETLARRAVDHGVAVVPGTAFRVGRRGHEDRLRLSWSLLAPDEAPEAARRLAAAWADRG